MLGSGTALGAAPSTALIGGAKGAGILGSGVDAMGLGRQIESPVDEIEAESYEDLNSKTVELANDTGYWFAVFFHTREQRDHFLTETGMGEAGHANIDGQVVAKKMSLALPPRPAPYKTGRIDRKLRDFDVSMGFRKRSAALVSGAQSA